MEAALPRTAASRAFRALAAIPPPPLAELAAPLDRLRSRLLRALAPAAPSLVVSRERRVALAATCLLFAALVSASVIPLWAVAIGPILWGIPHIVSDVRYLVARPGYHRRPLILAAMGLGIVLGGMGWGLRGGLVGAAAALVASRAGVVRKTVGLVIVTALFWVAALVGPVSDVYFGHLHNVVGVGLWWAWRRRSTRLHWLPIALFFSGSALILMGATAPITAPTGGLVAPWTGLSVEGLGYALSPTQLGPWPNRFVALYAFAQAAHYIVWLRLMPEEDRPSPTPRSYGQTFRALSSDVSAIVMWTAFLGAIALACWAAVSLGEARNGYIRMAFFHGYLELAAIAVLWAEAGREGAWAPKAS